MESLNFFKGYGKVSNPAEHNQQQPKRLRAVLAVSFIVGLTIIVAVLIGALVRDTEPLSEDNQPSAAATTAEADPTESLKTVCSVTQYLDSCINSISPLNEPPRSDPVHFYNLSLQVAIRELTNLTALPAALISRSGDPKAEAALRDCASLFADSLSQVNQSAELMKPPPASPAAGKLLTEMRISDMLTWISAAMTDQETCLDGLDEMGSTVVDELRARVHRSSEYMSNSLAILNNLKNLVAKFGLSMP